MTRTMTGPCEAAIVVASARHGIAVMEQCGNEGVEREDINPNKAIHIILCDEHYEEERARRLPG